jgi:hypothetical protein
VKENYKQIDYTAYETGYQLKLPVETEIFISKDAPVRLLNAIVDLAGHEKELLAQMTVLLVEWGFVSLESVFIDGTKIEANANRYSFV